MSDMVTRCPQCRMAFRISDAHLKSAKGIVRCGSCLSVFNAREHLETRASTTSSSPISPESTPQTPPPADVSSEGLPDTSTEPMDDDDFLIDDDFDDDELIFDSADDETYIEDDTSSSNLFESRTTKPPHTAEEEEEDDTDESWALELLKDDSDLDVKFRKIVTREAPGDASKPSEDLAQDLTHLDFEIPPSEQSNAEVRAALGLSKEDEHSATAASHTAVRRVERAVEARPEPTDAPQKATVTHIKTPAKKSVAVVDANAAPDGTRELKAGFLHTPENELRAVQQMIASIEPDSVEVGWRKRPALWRKRFLWMGMILAALLVLLIQVAWLQFDRLNTVQPYRAFYATACAVLPCALPPMQDRSQIKTSNLYVRSHPQAPNALQIDVVLQNAADFEQTFPDLLLTFRNLKNEPVAQRRFTPDEYLGGELSGSDAMPPGTPVIIELEIVDPGEEAVSYSIAIVD